jgi:hypothetical protein
MLNDPMIVLIVTIRLYVYRFESLARRIPWQVYRSTSTSAKFQSIMVGSCPSSPWTKARTLKTVAGPLFTLGFRVRLTN